MRRAYLLEGNPLRASVVADPSGQRQNTSDNAPAVLQVEMVAGDTVEVHISAKGGGSGNKTRFAVRTRHASPTDAANTDSE
nr:fumarate hydratase [Maritimibacter sp. 55A14]